MFYIPFGLMGYSNEICFKYNAAEAKKQWLETSKAANVDPKFEIRFLVFVSPERMNFVEQITADIERSMGVKVKIVNHFKVSTPARADEYDFFYYNYSPDFTHPASLLDFFTNNKEARIQENFPDYNSAVDALKQAQTDKEIVEKTVNAQNILLIKHKAIVPLFSFTNMMMRSKRVKAAFTDPLGVLRLESVELY